MTLKANTFKQYIIIFSFHRSQRNTIYSTYNTVKSTFIFKITKYNQKCSRDQVVLVHITLEVLQEGTAQGETKSRRPIRKKIYIYIMQTMK